MRLVLDHTVFCGVGSKPAPVCIQGPMDSAVTAVTSELYHPTWDALIVKAPALTWDGYCGQNGHRPLLHCKRWLWARDCLVGGHCICPVWNRGARITLLQGGYFPDHIWWKPTCSIYLIDPRAGQYWAKARHLLTLFHSIFWVEIHRKAKPHFFQPRGC